ncbi:unnamed protein product, partial [Darwinula stevensoni]
ELREVETFEFGPGTGRCVCEKGWTGTNCDELCPDGTYGEECEGNCSSCVHGMCLHTTGECLCDPGFTGETCEDVCPKHRFGFLCKRNCTCKNGGECHHITGECNCLDGWRGAECEEPCPEGTFGFDCRQNCSCDGRCNVTDGECKCLPGWVGTSCQEACPEGFFGEQCKNVCECSEGKFQCHHIDGCTCKLGFQGDNCELPLDLPIPHSTQQSEGRLIIQGLIGGTVLTILFILGLAGFLAYLRRRALIQKKQSREAFLRNAPLPGFIMVRTYKRKTERGEGKRYLNGDLVSTLNAH